MAQQQLKVFVSHNHKDDAFYRELVQALRQAGADVWYDEHNLGSGQLMSVIQRELGVRPVFVVILSKAAFASRWVKRETTWAYELFDRDPTRTILPVTAGSIDRNDFSSEAEWLFLHDFKRIEAPGYQPFPRDEVVRRTLRTLTLTPASKAAIPMATIPMAPLPADKAPAPTAPQRAESADNLVARAKALHGMECYPEALPLVERATQLAPGSFDAWFHLAYTLAALKRYEEALPAYERATTLNPISGRAWNNNGAALRSLNRSEEALEAYERATTIDPTFAPAWRNKARTLRVLGQTAEAEQAERRAKELGG